MKPKPCPAACLLLAAFFTSTPAQAQEVEAIHYAKDADHELVLTPADDGAFDYELRVFGAVGRIGYTFGKLTKSESAAAYQEEEEVEIEGFPKYKRTVHLTGKIAAPSITLKATGVKTADQKELPIDGAYKLVPAKDLRDRAQKRHAAADSLLNERYKKLIAELAAEPFRLTELKDAQRNWIKRRDGLAQAQPRILGEGDDKPFAESLAYWDSMLDQTVTRLEFLAAFSGEGIPPGIDGEYGDFNGGHLTLKETKEGLEFTFEVVRGASSNLGAVTGVAKLNADKSKATWIDTSEENKAADCRLTFTFASGRIVTVEGQNTDYYHGAHAHFDGKYFKEKPKPNNAKAKEEEQ